MSWWEAWLEFIEENPFEWWYSPIRVSPFLSVIFMFPILQSEFDAGSFLQISITASRQQRVSALLIVTIPTHQSSKKATKGNKR